jgi:hypothetical protein
LCVRTHSSWCWAVLYGGPVFFGDERQVSSGGAISTCRQAGLQDCSKLLLKGFHSTNTRKRPFLCRDRPGRIRRLVCRQLASKWEEEAHETTSIRHMQCVQIYRSFPGFDAGRRTALFPARCVTWLIFVEGADCYHGLLQYSLQQYNSTV